MINDRQLGSLSDGDPEEDAYRASVNGDEAVGGSTAVPSQNDTEELAQAVGIIVDDESPLDIQESIEQRDRERWELDPDSASED